MSHRRGHRRHRLDLARRLCPAAWRAASGSCGRVLSGAWFSAGWLACRVLGRRRPPGPSPACLSPAGRPAAAASTADAATASSRSIALQDRTGPERTKQQDVRQRERRGRALHSGKSVNGRRAAGRPENYPDPECRRSWRWSFRRDTRLCGTGPDRLPAPRSTPADCRRAAGRPSPR